jgi:hypothetical protein
MFCVKCGNEIAESAVFCSKCGNKMADVATTTQLEAIKTENKKGMRKFVTCVIWVCIMIGSAYILLSLFGGSGSSDKLIDLVRNGTLNNYPHKTVGEAFDGYLSNAKWEAGVSEDGQTFVNVSGGILVLGQKSEIRVQFIVDVDKGTFQYNACEINGVQQSDLIFWGLLENVYE